MSSVLKVQTSGKAAGFLLVKIRSGSRGRRLWTRQRRGIDERVRSHPPRGHRRDHRRPRTLASGAPPLRHHVVFGINAWTGREAGDRIINEHDEEGEDEELYFVHSGRARFEFDGEPWMPRPARSPSPARREADGVRRGAWDDDSRGGGQAGEGQHGDRLGARAPAGRLYEEERYAEAADLARELAAAHPEYPALLYNLACSESLAGRKADAIEHLRLAIEKSDSVRSYLAGDSDLDPLREEPEFQALLRGS